MCVKFEIPNYNTLDRFYICMACNLLLTDFHAMLNHNQNVHIILCKEHGSTILYFYLDKFLILYRFLLVVIIVCHFTTGSKIMDVSEVKTFGDFKKQRSLFSEH